MKKRADLTAKIEAVIAMGEKVLETETKGFQQQTFVNEQQFHDFRISGISLLSRIFGDKNQHYQCFKTEVTSPGASRTRRGLGILSAARTELQGNWVETTRASITSEILTEFMAMAKTNIEAGNLHSAAILICAVVEKHLRNLCLANDISTINELVHSTTLKKPLQLNGEAYKKKLYDRQQNRKIISWFELRDGAEPTTVNDILVKQLESMHADVTKFMSQTPY
jgi:hypothetical protein